MKTKKCLLFIHSPLLAGMEWGDLTYNTCVKLLIIIKGVYIPRLICRPKGAAKYRITLACRHPSVQYGLLLFLLLLPYYYYYYYYYYYTIATTSSCSGPLPCGVAVANISFLQRSLPFTSSPTSPTSGLLLATQFNHPSFSSPSPSVSWECQF